MYFLAGLIFIYGVLWLLSLAGVEMFASDHIKGTYAAAVMFMYAGILHFARQKQFIKLLPDGIWNKKFTNWFIGFAEIALGICLFIEELRINAALALILLLIAVFPANLRQANEKANAYNLFRLILQPVFILWIYWFCIYHTW